MLGRASSAGFVLAGVLAHATAAANVTLEVVAIRGQQAPGTPAGVLFASPGPPVLNEAGDVAFQSTLQVGAGGVDTSNDTGIWRRDRTGAHGLVAREGDPAPGAPGGASHSSIESTTGMPRLNAQGQVAFYGGFQSSSATRLGIYGPSGSSDLTLLAAASLLWGSPPGVPGALFASFERPSLDAAGEVVFLADMAENVGGVTVANDGGMWGTLGGGQLALLYRENDVAPAEAGGARWGAWRAPRLNDAGELAFWASLQGPGVTEYNRFTHWGPGPGGVPTLLTRTGDLVPPGANPGETPNTLSSPEIDGDGAIAFFCSLSLAPFGSGTAWASFGPNGQGSHTLAFREGEQAPGLPPGALVFLPARPVVDDAGEAAHLVTLAVDGVVVTPGNNQVLWGPGTEGPLTLLARTGDQAGGLPAGALYASFDLVKIGSGGDVVFLAHLVQGSGGVTAADDQALFMVPRNGEAVALLREGQSIEVAPGDVRTLIQIELYQDDLRSDDRDRVVNASRQVALRATFSDGARAVLVAALAPIAAVPSATPPAVLAMAFLLLASGVARLARRQAAWGPPRGGEKR